MNRPVYAVVAKCSSNPSDFKKWRKVTNLKKFHEWLIQHYPDWKFYNIYDKKTREWIDCIKKPQKI